MKINFDELKVYTDIARTQFVKQNVRHDFANFIYTQGSGIAAHALAMKIYNGDAETEYNEEELALMRRFIDNCTPCVIDAFHQILDGNQKTGQP